MTGSQSNAVLLTIMGKDRVGIVSAVTSYLFDTGANLADSAFAVLGEGFEFSCVAELEGATEARELEEGLAALDLLKGARITACAFPFELMRDDRGTVSHTVEITGGDRPGLVARISEVLVNHGANIVRMNSRRISTNHGADYRTRFAVNIADEDLKLLEAALFNTAGSMRLDLTVEAV
ncbi:MULTISPECIES: glycine cleavage system protein R [Kordiimonas]|uniref:glycine cleavage system protein R n=1 Tax=Kordiimonas TaxID=288021 RepID=UPI001FF6D5C3|nr:MULTISPECIES: ACT domain-containing protein [Kordiimonas]MCK0070516.1 ACT domain-containing protein [Kordiimonas laminariae]UTW57659.1 ACT domain-containing protein [Kordiimonas sp. SCSIO 12603]